ncbi:flagellar biosynthesis anti-sigma factor FlgM [Pantoea sp. AS142]|uniref:flagellar biosynthesis anti-sigma factor FlgM n=1 Tax=Pantoea sp. AS142 TaxID=3081292 RepID=UPI00301804A0
MSIEHSQKISPAVFTKIHPEAAKQTDRRTVQGATTANKTRTGTKVSLSNQIQSLQTNSSQDINVEHLDKIKVALAAGDLPIDTDKIANALTKEMFQII